ncbi:hypothetical protein LLS1_24330 [Leifsonia sp. LS1]|uniref:WXG100 family type VII secretion target n=1 Tax=Leifsonia sp. LS1 TaxID=2828483 RepID=UPI001CFE6F76|nr:WXG100 family type VII secretion target [Leifsonia sp. LS1]GIT80764.1 hypothetical protein LLS1_24330 [Leifsonia sp. LS1]
MSVEFAAQTGSIADAAHATQTCANEIEEVVQGLVSRTSAQLEGWQGPAADAYRRAVEKWNGDARSILDALTSIARALSVSQENYDQAETEHLTALEKFTYAI